MNTSEKSQSFWPIILPFLVFMVVSFFEPQVGDSGDNANVFLLIYALKISAMVIMIVVFLKYYLAHFQFRITWWGVAIGLLGGVAWIGICYLQLEKAAGSLVGLPESWFDIRSSVNPGQHYASPWPLFGFYTIRFVGLVVAVPIAEELFLRGFLIRYLEDNHWWKVKFHHLGAFPLIAATLYGVITHPSEALAAIVWFSAVTWLMLKTRSLWDCILAHAITNLMLGLYIVSFSQWHLW